MIGDSDLNGARYFSRIKNMIKKSKLIDNKQKEKLHSLLEETSGITD